MSCVGQAHPEFWKFSEHLEQEYGVKVEMVPVEAWGLTYGALSQRLHFSGVEVLLIDAEGFDCQILHSMLDYCNREGGEGSWPDVIQFETRGSLLVSKNNRKMTTFEDMGKSRFAL